MSPYASLSHNELIHVLKLNNSTEKVFVLKKDITPLLTHWSYVFLALTHEYIIIMEKNALCFSKGPECCVDCPKVVDMINWLLLHTTFMESPSN